jgi:CheY-like chemotaxis protein
MPTILVVEDELDVATMIGTVLEDEGYEVILARHGREALDILAARRPDLVLSDLMMPVMDGYALLAAMQANFEWQSIPLVLVSAGAPPPDS